MMMAWFDALMERRCFRRGAPLAIVVLIVGSIAAGTAIGTTATCTSPPAPANTTLDGSAFEIDTNANLVVNTSGCIDWLTGGSGTDFRSTVKTKIDRPTGSTDDSFGNGTKENDSNPTIVDGSIPNNKSDLKVFGVNTETNTNGKFLELFWTRVNSAQGTANMDFELNQKFCDPSKTPTNCANNSHTPPETPIRTTGDKLITYDLSQGGSVPTISIRTWNESSSSWGAAVCLFTPGGCAPGAAQLAIGSINSSGIGVNDAGKVLNTYVNPPVLQNVGPISELSFGEAAIDFKALFSENKCGSFGSAYLKSRSSTSFTSEIKDFIAPERVTITNCPTTIATTLHPAGPITVGDSVFDSATLSGATSDAGGTVTYTVYTDNACSLGARDAGTKTVTNGVVPDSNSLQFNTPGDFYWQAVYSGDSNNKAAKSDCTSEHLVVGKAPANLATSQKLVPQDSATLTATAGGTPTGTVDFVLYSGADCSGTPVYQELNVPLTNGTANTNNTTFFVDAASSGDYKWIVTYSGDDTHNGATSACGKEAFTATIDNDTTN